MPARLEFGNSAVVREDVRARNGFGWFDRLSQDVRYGARRVTRTPGISLVIVGVLALGIGFNAAIFAFIYSWNEYFEQTAIEPADAWGDRYLAMTACYAAQAHRGTSRNC